MNKVKISKDGLKNVKPKAGIYRIYPCNGKKPVYIGTSKNMRHRLQSYYQKDDFSVNRTKEDLRPKACKVTYKYLNINQARNIEKKEKSNYKHNHR